MSPCLALGYTSAMKLYIGNKNYSSWSMRPWVVMRAFGIAFDEVMLWFDDCAPGSVFKQAALAVAPTGQVPVLVDGELSVWDSLAIVEYLAERYPERGLWPQDAVARAQARCICAEMHSGFRSLRSKCSMNIEAELAEVGARVLAEEPGVVADLHRIGAIWTSALARSGGPFLFGEFSIADAYYAPVVARVRTYGLPMPAATQAWMARVWATPAVSDWVREALREERFVAIDEPYRQHR